MVSGNSKLDNWKSNNVHLVHLFVPQKPSHVSAIHINGLGICVSV